MTNLDKFRELKAAIEEHGFIYDLVHHTFIIIPFGAGTQKGEERWFKERFSYPDLGIKVITAGDADFVLLWREGDS